MLVHSFKSYNICSVREQTTLSTLNTVPQDLFCVGCTVRRWQDRRERRGPAGRPQIKDSFTVATLQGSRWSIKIIMLWRVSPLNENWLRSIGQLLQARTDETSSMHARTHTVTFTFPLTHFNLPVLPHVLSLLSLVKTLYPLFNATLMTDWIWGAY